MICFALVLEMCGFFETVALLESSIECPGYDVAVIFLLPRREGSKTVEISDL